MSTLMISKERDALKETNAELLYACRAVYKARGDKEAMVKALILCGAAIMKATPPTEAERGEGR